MSSNRPLIRVSNLGKKYRIKESLSAQRNLAEEITKWLKKPWQFRAPEKDFWALQDLNFTIQAGECVGVVGHNGSGKSTLLKILSRITWPTTGRVEIDGRISALLEVGTGFHLELTGRENIFLSGAMLGMQRAEVNEHFDEIIAFSEIEPFIDTPVKKYSSGMFLRLAFSIMVHLRSDILIIDEILAVGDASFQKKSLQKMTSIIQQGRTVIIVSHLMDKLHTLCNRVLEIKQGHLIKDGPTQKVLKEYSLL